MGLCGMVTVQSLADLDQKIGKNPQLFVDQVMDCCNVYVVHRMNTGSSSETLSESIGTKDSVEITSQLGDIGATGTGSAKLVREFIVHPDQIKKLETGELFVNDKPKGTVARALSRYSKIFK